MLKRNSPKLKGPIVFENWKDYFEGKPHKKTDEYTLYTDTHIVGDEVSFGPYKIINAISTTSGLKPAIILRVEDHREDELWVADWSESDETRYHGGLLDDEIAALISLCLGIRAKSGGMSRQFGPGGDPKGRPVYYNFRGQPTLLRLNRVSGIIPSAVGIRSIEHARILVSLSKLEVDEVIALVRAARLYQDALWIVESQPALAWLLLVSAVEVAALNWREEKYTSVEVLTTASSKLAELLVDSGGEELLEKTANLLSRQMSSTNRFISFLIEFMPKVPKERPPKHYRISWKKSNLKKEFSKIYGYRSNALHEGIPFPLPLCEPPQNLNQVSQKNHLGCREI